MALIGSIGSTIAKSVLPAGTVLQVVQSTTTARIETSSTTYQATGLIASLTPTSATSKILVSVSGGGGWSNSIGGGLDNKLYRQIASGGYSALTAQLQDWEFYGSASSVISPHSFIYLDSPATTSQVFYQPYFRTNPSGSPATVEFNVAFYAVGATRQGVVTLTLMEIAA